MGGSEKVGRIDPEPVGRREPVEAGRGIRRQIQTKGHALSGLLQHRSHRPLPGQCKEPGGVEIEKKNASRRRKKVQGLQGPRDIGV